MLLIITIIIIIIVVVVVVVTIIIIIRSSSSSSTKNNIFYGISRLYGNEKLKRLFYLEDFLNCKDNQERSSRMI